MGPCFACHPLTWVLCSGQKVHRRRGLLHYGNCLQRGDQLHCTDSIFTNPLHDSLGIHASRYISSIRYKCSLPHAQLTAVPTGYVAHRCPSSITIDGRLDEPCWQAAAPTEDFVDIVGPTGPEPWLQTTAKILWDDANLYISAELEDPRVFAQETLHDRSAVSGHFGLWAAVRRAHTTQSLRLPVKRPCQVVHPAQ